MTLRLLRGGDHGRVSQDCSDIQLVEEEREDMKAMGIGTRIIGIIALFGCILMADSIYDCPLALVIALASLIILAWIGRKEE